VCGKRTTKEGKGKGGGGGKEREERGGRGGGGGGGGVEGGGNMKQSEQLYCSLLAAAAAFEFALTKITHLTSSSATPPHTSFCLIAYVSIL